MCSCYLTLSFKVLERLRIPVFQSVVFNYLTCVATGIVVSGGVTINSASFNEPWFSWAILMGLIFIVLFNLIGFTAQTLGVAVASVANKLSLVIPFVFSLYLYNESATWVKITGIFIALLAVVLTCLPSKANAAVTKEKPAGLKLFLLPAILFLGSGLLDTLVKYVEQTYLNGANNNAYLISSFGTAGVIGGIVLLVLIGSGKQAFDKRSIVAGIAIGIPNYFSILFLVKVLSAYKGNSSAIIPVNNMSIVLVSAVAAALLFGEKLSLLNWIGIVAALAAIALIAFG